MGKIRVSLNFSRTMNQIEKMELADGLKSLATLVGKPSREEKIPTKYSEGDGKPTEFKWEGKQWDGRINTYGEFFADGIAKNSSFGKKIHLLLPPGSCTIVTLDDGETVVVYHDPGKESSTPPQLYFMKPVRLK